MSIIISSVFAEIDALTSFFVYKLEKVEKAKKVEQTMLASQEG
jgi:hypothetical protein